MWPESPRSGQLTGELSFALLLEGSGVDLFAEHEREERVAARVQHPAVELSEQQHLRCHKIKLMSL